MMEGKFRVPDELCVGNTFSGFKVESSENTETCHVWVFSRGNNAVVLSLPYDEYFTLLSNPAEGERIMDALAAEVHRSFREKESKIYGF